MIQASLRLFTLSLLCLFVSSLRREGYTMQVNVNDYLDIYCPHYNDSQRMVGTGEQYVLYMVSYRGYRNCDPQLGFKRWECNRPHAPHAPIKFSEKFQRYSAFSLGYEFHVGQEYYYICECTSKPVLSACVCPQNLSGKSIRDYSKSLLFLLEEVIETRAVIYQTRLNMLFLIVA